MSFSTEGMRLKFPGSKSHYTHIDHKNISGAVVKTSGPQVMTLTQTTERWI